MAMQRWLTKFNYVTTRFAETLTLRRVRLAFCVYLEKLKKKEVFHLLEKTNVETTVGVTRPPVMLTDRKIS